MPREPQTPAPPQRPALSLIVCTLGRAESLDRLFRSLARQTATDFEIVLVDQNPPGQLDSMVMRYSRLLPIRHLRSAPGLSRARNVGLHACRGALVAFPDDDCWYDNDVVEKALAFFDTKSSIAALTGRTLNADGEESLARYLPESAPITRSNVFLAGTSNTLFVRREAALAVSGFDESLGVGAGTPYLSGEETDFILRILAAGDTGRFEHDFCVRHPHNRTDGAASVRRASAYSAGFGRLLRLHDYSPVFLGTRVARATLRGFYCLMRGDRIGAETRFRWAAGSIRGYVDRAASSRATRRRLFLSI